MGELEHQATVRKREDEKRYRELIERFQKDKSFEMDSYQNRIISLEQEVNSLRDDVRRRETMIKSVQTEKQRLEDQLCEARDELEDCRKELHKLRDLLRKAKDEDSVNRRVIEVLNDEMTELRKISPATSSNGLHDLHNMSSSTVLSSDYYSGDSQSRHSINGNSQRRKSTTESLMCRQLEDELSRIREENRSLKELNEELEMQMLSAHIHEGRSLVNQSIISHGSNSLNLAEEISETGVQKVSFILMIDVYFS